MKKPMVNFRNVVIRSLEAQIAISENNGWKEMSMTIDTAKEILSLLEEHEPVEPEVTSDRSFAPSWYYRCGNCDEPIDPLDKYCRYCGRKQKWPK